MRLVFAGTPEFAAKALAALHGARHEIPLVLTQPDRPVGRGLKMLPSPVKQLALECGLQVAQPATVKSDEALERIRDARPDVLVVAAYGMILPQRLLDAPRLGALNIHASLLPRWRGAAPIQRALLAGDTETGISIMQMDAGLDTGPVLKRQSIEISLIDDGGTIHDRLAALGARMIVDTLSDLQAGRAHAEPQPAEGVTYAAKISKQDTVLDWRRPAVELERMVRAFRPAPGAVTSLDGEPLKIWRASVLDGQASPGSIAIEGGALVVGCSSGRLKIEELQKAGGRRMPAGEFVRGFTIRPGARLA